MGFCFFLSLFSFPAALFTSVFLRVHVSNRKVVHMLYPHNPRCIKFYTLFPTARARIYQLHGRLASQCRVVTRINFHGVTSYLLATLYTLAFSPDTTTINVHTWSLQLEGIIINKSTSFPTIKLFQFRRFIISNVKTMTFV